MPIYLSRKVNGLGGRRRARAHVGRLPSGVFTRNTILHPQYCINAGDFKKYLRRVWPSADCQVSAFSNSSHVTAVSDDDGSRIVALTTTTTSTTTATISLILSPPPPSSLVVVVIPDHKQIEQLAFLFFFYSTLVISPLGFIANLFAVAVFVASSNFRRTSTVQYLLGLSVVDSSYLIGELLHCLSTPDVFGRYLTSIDFVDKTNSGCKTVMWLRYRSDHRMMS